MQRRPYGTTGIELSLIGFGGIVAMGADQTAANRRVAEAVDRGVNYFDVAPSYGNTEAEQKLGPALAPYRDQVFLACKTAHRTRKEAAQELRDSLQRMKTDRFDLYQLHAITTVADVETAFGPGGAMEAILEARDAGLIQHIGFSAHSTEAARCALEKFPFASALFPINHAAWTQGDFGPELLRIAVDHGAARLALKGMARRRWLENADRSMAPLCWYEPHTDPALAELALRWTLSQPITAMIPPGEAAYFSWALDFAQRFTPLSADERAQIESLALEGEPIFATAAL